jgi:SAM-dependent methyltransferase
LTIAASQRQISFVSSEDVKPSLRELALRQSVGDNPHTKLVIPGIYELYDDYFSALRSSAIVLLELGVAQGESLKAFAGYFEHGTIVGLDIEDRGLDFSSHPNVRYAIGDQRDAARLAEVCAAYAPQGLDIIIDDASHVGVWSLTSYRALFPFLKPGGLYIIEDWATGYWTDWPDGGPFEDVTPSGTNDAPETHSEPRLRHGRVHQALRGRGREQRHPSKHDRRSHQTRPAGGDARVQIGRRPT